MAFSHRLHQIKFLFNFYHPSLTRHFNHFWALSFTAQTTKMMPVVLMCVLNCLPKHIQEQNFHQ